MSLPERARVIVTSLYEERGAELLHFALAVARDEELARDALQEAFMRYFVALSEGNEIASPRAWVYRVTHNYLLDRMKEAYCHNRRYLGGERSSDQDIERDCFRSEIMQLFRTALTTREYDCLHLRSEGLRYEEIAAALHMTTGTVGALISRAVRRMRSLLTPGRDLPAQNRERQQAMRGETK